MQLKIYFILILLINLKKCFKIKKVSDIEKTKEFWIEKGKDQLLKKLNENVLKTKSKNIILFIGDGMSIATITTARIYKNQRMMESKSPDENLIFENFPNVGLSKTYCVNDYVCDSASTASAILTGVKTNSKVLGLSPRIKVSNCQMYDPKQDNLVNIADLFYQQNKSLGIVTTASITDATPSAIYANIPNRSWKHKVKKNCPFKDIATQLIEKSEMFQVIFGGGRKSFLNETDDDPEYKNIKGSRTDGNLITKWKAKMKDKSALYMWNNDQFNALETTTVDNVLGIFAPENMLNNDLSNEAPKLFQMTTKAINILSKNKNGFFLLVEEERIDTAHHANEAFRALLHTLELEKAIEQTLKMIDSTETLVIVTADHSHVMTLGSYASRESDITAVNVGFKGNVTDNIGHTSLLYSNGPSFKNPRENITDKTIFTPQSKYHAGVLLDQETHGGEEVTVYAQGPWAHLLKDIYEQSFIGHVMMYSSCCGIYVNREGCVAKYGLKNLYEKITIMLSVIILLMHSHVLSRE